MLLPSLRKMFSEKRAKTKKITFFNQQFHLRLFDGWEQPSKKYLKIIIYSMIIFTLNVLLYIRTVDYDFLKDDFRLIVENPRIKSFSSLLNSFSDKYFSFPDYPYLRYWRPFSLFSYFIDYQLWGAEPSGYHLTNILINGCCALLILLIFLLLSNNFTLAFTISLFFSLHPTHIEAVSWISGRTDLLSAGLSLAVILFFFLYIKQRNKSSWFYSGAIIAYITGLMSKENALLVPFFLTGWILFSWLEKRNINLKNFLKELAPIAPFWIITLFYLLLHAYFTGAQKIVSRITLKDIPIIIKTIGVYTRAIIFPFFSNPYFSMDNFEQKKIEHFLFFLIAIAILILVLSKRKDYKYSIFSLLFLIFLLPVLNPEIIPSYPKIVLRFAYLPAVWAGVFFLESIRLIKTRFFKNSMIILLILIAISWGGQSFFFQSYFKNQFSYYNEADGLTRFHPNDCSLLLPWALLIAEQGNYSYALSVVERALKITAKDRWMNISEEAEILKANLLLLTGKREDGKKIALQAFFKTTRKEIKYYAYLVLSKYYEKSEKLKPALTMLENAEKIGQTADLFFRKAIILARQNEFAQALKTIAKAKALNPGNNTYQQLEEQLKQLQQQNYLFRR